MTRKVTLRLIERVDLPKLLEHRNLPSTRRWLGVSREITATEHALWFDSLSAAAFSPSHLIAVYDGSDVGIVRCSGVWVGADVFEAFRGTGLGHEVFKAACDLARERGARELRLKVFTQNYAAVMIYTKAGFVFDPDVPIEFYMRDGIAEEYATMVRPA